MLISFLKAPNWISSVQDGLMGSILGAIRTFCFNLDAIIYELIIHLYNLFEKLCTARLLDGQVINELSKRIGFILGMVMFFSIIFSFIQMLIEPDVLNDKERGAAAILKKSLLVIVMLGISNFAFDKLYDVQSLVIKNHVISNFILPYQISETTKNNFGGELSANLMMAFYQVESFENVNFTHETTQMLDSCEDMTELFIDQIVKNGRFDLGYTCLNESVKIEYGDDVLAVDQVYENDEVYVINFNWLISVLAGLAVAYFLLMYCFTVGVRMIQLTVLEIISPMAIISYLSPKKDTMFSKWTKIYFSTYIDVFIRMAIINFVVFLIAALFSSDSLLNGSFIFWDTVNNPTDSKTVTFFTVVLIVALLMFAKKAPDLIKELFPSGASKLGFGGVGFKDMLGGNAIKKGLTKSTKIATGILGGAAAGGAIGLIGGVAGGKGFKERFTRGIGGVGGGFLRGGLSGFKGQGLVKTTTGAWKAQGRYNKRISDWRNDGGESVFGRWGAGLAQTFGLDTKADRFDAEKAKLEEENSAYKQFDGYIDAAEKRAESQILKGEFNHNKLAQDALQQKNLAEIYRQQSATIKRSDFENSDNYRNKVASKFNVKRDDYADDLSYQEAIRQAISTNDYSFEKFVNEEYNAALENLAKLASDADSSYLVKMKEAKKAYITEKLAINAGTKSGKADEVLLQSLDQAAGVVDANSHQNYEGFEGTSKESLLAGNYDSFDTVNSKSKTRQSANNNELGKNAREGREARANAKHSGVRPPHHH